MRFVIRIQAALIIYSLLALGIIKVEHAYCTSLSLSLFSVAKGKYDEENRNKLKHILTLFITIAYLFYQYRHDVLAYRTNHPWCHTVMHSISPMCSFFRRHANLF